MPAHHAELFTPVSIGEIACPNRVFMAPLTRMRARVDDDAPWALNVEYYRQRAGAGLIISEATQVEPRGKGYPRTPGCHSPAQEAGWRLVTDAVHAAGGRILAQLWHVGPISHPDHQPGGALPVAASARDPGGLAFTVEGRKARVVPRALRADELPGIVSAYREAAASCLRAGFDGVEIHAAHGYLLENFTRDSTNARTDAWGGPVQNRIRLTLEVIDAAVSVWGRGRVGVRLSPVSNANGSPPDSNPQATYGAVVDARAARRIAFVHMVEGDTGVARVLDGFDFAGARRAFPGAYIANNGYDAEMAARAIREKTADAVAFGMPFIANPDLPSRLREGVALAQVVRKTIYADGAEGYTDYPAAA